MRRAISALYAFRTSDQKVCRYRRSSSRPSRRTEYRRRLPRGSTRTNLASSSTFGQRTAALAVSMQRCAVTSAIACDDG